MTDEGPEGAGPVLALVALGSNLAGERGDPAAQVRAAMAEVATLGEGPATLGRLWRSPAWPPGGPPYVNAAMAIRTRRPAEALLDALHAIEASFGRERSVRWGARTLDLDLLAWGDRVAPDAATEALWRELPPERQGREAPAALILPHPRLADRAFVLRPLLEVAPLWRHPATGRTVAAMAAALPPAAREGVEPLGGGAALANPRPAD